MDEQSTKLWPDAGPVPDRGDILAAAELAELRRILAIDVTTRTLIPSHEWIIRDSAPVRLEVSAGISLADVMRSLEWLQGMLPKMWHILIDELGAELIAKEYQSVDLRDATIDGVALADWQPNASAGNAKTDDGLNGV